MHTTTLQGRSDAFERWLPSFLMLGLLAYLVLVPLVILLVSSIKPTGMPLDPGWTLEHFAQTYSDPAFYRMAATTFIFAIGSALGALSIGIVMAWLVERTDLPGRGFVRVMILLPMATPPVLLAIAWVMLASPRTGFFNEILSPLLGEGRHLFDIFSLPGMIFVESLSLAPTTFLILSPAFRNMDPNLEEAARASGAGMLTMIRRVMLPVLFPSLLAATGLLLMFGLLVFDIPGTLGMPVGIFVLSSQIVYLVNDAPGGLAEYGPISAMAIFFLVILLMITWGYRRATRNASRYVTMTGKSFRIRPYKLRRWKAPAITFVSLYFFFATIAPFAILIWTSLMPYQAGVSLDMIPKMTMANHMAFFTNSRAMSAAQNSVIIGGLAATTVALLSVLVSWLVIRSKVPGRNLIDLLSFLPLAIPGTMIGVALTYVYLTLGSLPIYGTIWIIVIAYVTTYIAFGTRTTHNVMLQLSPELEEASRASGAGWFRTMRRVVVPLTLPAIVAVWIWVVSHCLRELSSALLLQGFDNKTVPVLLWGYWTGGEPNKASAVGLWLILAMIILVSAWQILSARGRLVGVKA